MARAVRIFRAALGDTQRQFAKRMGLALTSVGRYETNFQPAPEVLQRFASVARRQQLVDLAEIFEGKTRPENTDLELHELAAVKGEIDRVFHGADVLNREYVRRVRLALWMLIMPTGDLRKVEGALGSRYLSKVDEFVNRRSGDLIRKTRRLAANIHLKK